MTERNRASEGIRMNVMATSKVASQSQPASASAAQPTKKLSDCSGKKEATNNSNTNTDHHKTSSSPSQSAASSTTSALKRPSPLSSSSATGKAPKLAISLPPAKDKSKTVTTLPVTQISSDVKKVFNDDDEDEVEEIPESARIRMRNKGRENPVACGPNSYGKSRLGFCDYRSMQERDLEEKAKELSNK